MDTLASETTATPLNDGHDSQIAGHSVQAAVVTPEETNPAQHRADSDNVSFTTDQDEDKAIGTVEIAAERHVTKQNSFSKEHITFDEDSESLGQVSYHFFDQKQDSRLLEDWCPAPETAKMDQSNVRPEVPHILWRVDVYLNSSPGEYRTLTFRNDRPYDLLLSQQLPTPREQPSETPGSERKEVPAPTVRDQPVFELETRVLGFLEQAESKRSKHQPRTHARESFDQLQIRKFKKMRLIIHSKPLNNALASLVSLSYYPIHSPPEETFIHVEPYALLMHHFTAIEDFAMSGKHGKEPEEAKDTDTSPAVEQPMIAVQHMKLLYNFLKPQYDDSIKRCLDSLSQPVPKISFDMLWYLFRPGVDVYIQSYDLISVCVIYRVQSNLDTIGSEWLSSTITSYWHLETWHLDTDGSRIARTRMKYQIRSYTGLRDVTTLPVCPVSYWDANDSGARRKQILQRSNMYVQALRAGNMLVSYDGPDLTTQRHYKGKVVVDVRRALTYDTDRKFTKRRPSFEAGGLENPVFAQYDHIFVNESEYAGNQNGRLNSSIKISPETQSSENVSDVDIEAVRSQPYAGRILDRDLDGDLDSNVRLRETAITEHQLLLLYPLTFAFAISSKQWMAIRTDRMQSIESSSESIANLVIDKDELSTIRALSNQQNSNIDSWSADFIAGKGSGQVILLHGPPGVGKTYTVESIAEWLHRPLLALTVADIGTLETRIEAELLKWFDLAEAWNAVLLVDEADIFLEQRRNRDLARNGLVSAFLRRMEYFNGLLFLTTNRVGQIDDAFISRVHIAIGYSSLNADIRCKIWDGFFKKLVKERAGKIKVTLNAKKWVLGNVNDQDELNGRDIRNALQAAIRLAEFEALEDPDHDPSESIVVEEAHFRRVLDRSNKFHKYINSIRKEDEAKRAGVRGDRNDYGKQEEDGAEWQKSKLVRYE